MDQNMIKDTIKCTLVGLDEDTLDYFTGIVLDDQDKSIIIEVIQLRD